MAFKIGEVAKMLGIRPSILRYWEEEFEELRPPKSSSNQRAYREQDIKAALMIKKLLYKDRFSIEGAKAVLKKEKFKKNVLLKNNSSSQSTSHFTSDSPLKSLKPSQSSFFNEDKKKKPLNARLHSVLKDSVSSFETQSKEQDEPNSFKAPQQIDSKTFVLKSNSSADTTDVKAAPIHFTNGEEKDTGKKNQEGRRAEKTKEEKKQDIEKIQMSHSGKNKAQVDDQEQMKDEKQVKNSVAKQMEKIKNFVIQDPGEDKMNSKIEEKMIFLKEEDVHFLEKRVQEIQSSVRRLRELLESENFSD